MRAVIQRVSEARVDVAGETVGSIGGGLLVLLGVRDGDDEADQDYIVRKIRTLRIFEDREGRMNHSVEETGGAVLIVSQFTLYGDCRKGRRPSFVQAMQPEPAERMVEAVIAALRQHGLTVETGQFGAHMDVHLVNDGPVTLLVDSEKSF